MSARLDDVPATITAQNGKKVFLQKATVTTTAGTITLLTADVEGNPIEAGAELCLQADQDIQYQLIPASASSSVTINSGARPGCVVPADLQEFVYKAATDGKVDAIARTATATLVIFHVV